MFKLFVKIGFQIKLSTFSKGEQKKKFFHKNYDINAQKLMKIKYSGKYIII